MNRAALIALALLLGSMETGFGQSPDSQPENDPVVRQWTDNTGNFSVRASIYHVSNDTVYLQRVDDGTVAPVPLRRLSAADQRWLEQYLRSLELTQQPESAGDSPADSEQVVSRQPASIDQAEQISPSGDRETGEAQPQPDGEKITLRVPLLPPVAETAMPDAGRNATPRPGELETVIAPQGSAELPHDRPSHEVSVPGTTGQTTSPVEQVAGDLNEFRESSERPSMLVLKHPMSRPHDGTGNGVQPEIEIERPEELAHTGRPVEGTDDQLATASDLGEEIEAAPETPIDVTTSDVANAASNSETPAVPVFNPAARTDIPEFDVVSNGTSGSRLSDEVNSAGTGELAVSASCRWRFGSALATAVQANVPELYLVLNVEGNLAGQVAYIGKISLDPMFDSNGGEVRPARLGPKQLDPLNDWVPAVPNLSDYTVPNAPESETRQTPPTAGVVRLQHTSAKLHAIRSITGSLTAAIPRAVQPALVSTNAADETNASNLLKERRLSVRASRPDDRSLVIEATGDVRNLLAAQPRLPDGIEATMSRSDARNSVIIQFEFNAPASDDIETELQIVTDWHEVVVPFDQRDLQVPFLLPGTRAD